ncbi:FimV family protein [Burkholderiaceae bacterium UC74_6]
MDRDFLVHPKAPSPLRPGAVMAGVIGLLMALPPSAQALGVSAPQTRSYLGQPLDLVFPIALAPGETLTAECVHAEVLAGDSRVPPSFVTVRLEGPNESNVRAVRIGTTGQINEPIVSVNFSLSCPIRMTRQYVALIDPQSTSAPSASPSVVAETVPQDVESQKYSPALRAALGTSESKPELLLDKPPAPPVVTASRAPAVRPPAPARPASQQQPAMAMAGGGEGAPAEKPRKAPKKRSTKPIETQVAAAAASSASASAPVSRLRLDSPEPTTAKSAVAAASAPAPARTASEVADAALSAIAASEAMQSRLSALEAGINKMQAENQAQQARMAQLQSQLESANASRGNGTLTWMLGLMVLGLGGFSVMQWRRHEQQRAEWWAAVDAAKNAERAPSPAAYRAPTSADGGASTWQPPLTSPIPIMDAQISGLADLDHDAGAPTLPGPPNFPEPNPLALADTAPIPFMDSQMKPMDLKLHAPMDPGPVVTVEELLDMEQQVEFFMVLGQTDAAIDLLRSRVDTGTSSALPYLKLLEVYQSLDDEPAFAELADRFASRFNALPPSWGGVAGEGLGLETAASALRQVQAVWTDPAASMEVLQKLLVHGDQSGSGAQAFDLPAYRDLLLLYSVARDLSEQEVRGGDIDVFLPLDSASPMMATLPWQRPGGPAPAGSVSVDISLDPLEPRS